MCKGALCVCLCVCTSIGKQQRYDKGKNALARKDFITCYSDLLKFLLLLHAHKYFHCLLRFYFSIKVISRLELSSGIKVHKFNKSHYNYMPWLLSVARIRVRRHPGCTSASRPLVICVHIAAQKGGGMLAEVLHDPWEFHSKKKRTVDEGWKLIAHPCLPIV